MGPLKPRGQIAAICGYCRLIVMNGIFKRYYYITFTFSISGAAFLVLSKWSG